MLNRSSRRHTGEAGFTLIELLVVIVVLGILSTIVTIAVSGTRKDAVGSACKTNFQTVELSAESYYTKQGNYPTTAAVQTELLQATGKGGVLKTWPTSTDYVLAYAQTGSGTGYTIDVKKTAAGASLGNTSAGCDAL
jgi:prepilin-type N-terminal cleavage/methylation domain-containing protein